MNNSEKDIDINQLLRTCDGGGTVEWEEVGRAPARPRRTAQRQTAAPPHQRFNWKPLYAIRTKMLRALGFDTYEAYLASEQWRQRRARFEEDYSPMCAYCGREADELHHLSYSHLGDERDDELQWVCCQHHQEIHENGSVQPATKSQQRVLIEHHFTEEFAKHVSFCGAWDLIGLLGRGLQPDEAWWRFRTYRPFPVRSPIREWR